MSDLIDRQAAIDALEHKKDKNAKGDIGGFYNKIIQNDIDALMQLPPAQRWIPCSERMPDENFGCLVTIYRDNYFSGEHNEVFYELVVWDGETWNDCFGVPMDDEVVAWIPFPTPYLEGGQHENI